MDAITSIKENFGWSHGMVEGTIEGLTSEQLHWLPAGTAHSIASTYAHMILGEDMLLNGMIAGKPPLAATTWAGKTGVSEMPPQGSEEGPGDWAEWAKKVSVDLPALAEYAKAVYANTDAYLNSLKPEELDDQIDGFMGKTSRNMMLQITAGHGNNHIGEISAIKGIQGLKGYPF